MSNDATPRNNRKMLWLVAAVCIAPFMASFAAYYFYQPDGRVNYGALLEAGPLPAVTLQLDSGAPFTFKQLEGKWLYVIIDDAACDTYCEKKLWQIRQVRKTQGKYPERIERVWLLTGGTPAERLRVEYDGSWMVQAAGHPLLEQFPFERARTDHIYLIDPLGNLVLRYPRDADASRMRKDIERLLKVSRIG